MNNRGQILVEAMIAITIATIGLLGIFTLVSRSLSLNRVVADQYIASNLAAEGIELVKNLIDYNVRNGQPFNAGDCLGEGEHEIDYNDVHNGSCPNGDRVLLVDNGIYSYDSGAETPYKRVIGIAWYSHGGNNDEIAVTSTVTWTTRGGGQFEVALEDHFFNWR